MEMHTANRLSHSFVMLSLTGLACLTLGASCWLSPPPATGSPADDGVSVQMVAAATTEIRKTDADAKVCWAGGRKSDGTQLQMPSDTNTWDFLAISVTSQGTRGWIMTYNGTWTVADMQSNPMGIEFLDLTQTTMDVVEAWSLAQAAGYAPPFRSWALLKPLNPNVAHIIYVFNMPDGTYVIVDSVTGQVTQERDAWDCYTRCREQYIDCCDDCRENWPGDPDCYDDCDTARNECDNDCG